MSTQLQMFHGGTYRMASGRSEPVVATHRVGAGEAMQLGRLGGELAVLQGRVWLTRDGDLGDHFIDAGQKVRLGIDENAVIESAYTGQSVSLHWTPRRQSFFGAVFAEPLRGAAFLAGVAARGFAALARRAAASACRAQGSIDCGDSIASSGALK